MNIYLINIKYFIHLNYEKEFINMRIVHVLVSARVYIHTEVQKRLLIVPGIED